MNAPIIAPRTYIKEGTIGSPDDPYGSVKVTTVRGSKTATLYWDGLGSHYLELRDGDMLCRREDWINSSDAKSGRVSAAAAARYFAHVGVCPKEAYEQWQERDFSMVTDYPPCTPFAKN